MAKKILLADDSMTIQKVVELTFLDQDYEVEAVSDGASAIAKIGELEPDIVIADVHMPGADGYEVCAKWKASSPATPVLLLVGTFEQFDEAKATQSGANDHLKKPFDSQELLQKVQSLVEGGGGAAAPAPAPAPTEAPPELSTQPAHAAPTAPAAPEPPVAPAAAQPPASPSPSESSSPAETVAVPEVQPTMPEPAAQPAASPQVAAPEAPTPQPAVEVQPPPVVPAEPSAPTPAAEDNESMRPSSAETRPRRAESTDDSTSESTASEAAPEATAANGSLSDEDVERIARKLLELAGPTAVKEVAWEVIPDLAEVVIRERIQELEGGVD